MVPHAGPDSRLFREVETLGAALRALAPVQGTTVPRADVAMVVDEESAWALGATRLPTDRLRPLDLATSWHRALGDRATAVDVVPSGASFDGRSVLILPTTYLVDDDLAARVRAFVEGGGHLLMSFASDVVDETNRIGTGGYPVRLRELLGIRVDEIRPVLEGERVALDDGGHATIWTERVEAVTAEVVRTYAEGPLAGMPAATTHRAGRGTATYLSCRADDESVARILHGVLDRAGVQPLVEVEGRVAVTRRTSEDGRSYLFLLNSSRDDATVHASGVDLLTGVSANGRAVIPAGGVVVLAETS